MSDEEFSQLSPAPSETQMQVARKALEQPLARIESPVAVTAAQAKVNAVASLTMKAYDKAGSLALTADESAKLQADFPDEAFKPGAAGKESLIYIEHPFLRDRFIEVFGMGGWAMVPRNRWAEPFRTQKGVDGQRIYVEAMLVVRGCFVAEAIGEMEYYPSNGSQNYGDATEGAETAAFRRCAKKFGVGLQAWKKDWCEGWWTRKRAQNAPGRTASPRVVSQQPPETPKAPAPTKPGAATPAYRLRMIQRLNAMPGEPARNIVTEYARACAMLLPNEQLENLDLCWVATSPDELTNWSAAIAAFEQGDKAEIAFPPHDGAKPLPKLKMPEFEPEPELAHEEEEEWKVFPMPFGKNAGVPLHDLDPKYLYGLWKNYTVETEYNGKPKKPETIAKDTKFREMLNAAGVSRAYK